MAEQGYTGRKLPEYTWIPKSKTSIVEHREFLKICKEVEDKEGFFNDRTAGELMVKKRAIVDRDNTSESYIAKYEKKTISAQSYVSNARMLIRICRWLGWITKTEEKAKFKLTPYGLALTMFDGEFPAEVQKVSEYNLVSTAFAKLKYYNVNDSIQYRNPRFKQRMFLTMLRVLSAFDYCSHYELVVSSFALKDERNEKEFKERLQLVRELKEGKITIGEALRGLKLDCKNNSTVTGVYDGPKVMLSFARQLGFVENIPVSEKQNPEIFKVYSKMYLNSGHIRPNGLKLVSRITENGRKYLEKHLKNQQIWFDELDQKIEESALLVFLNKTHLELSKKTIDDLNLRNAAVNLIKRGIISEKKDSVVLAISTDFDLFQDVPYEVRAQVIEKINKIEPTFISRYNIIADRMSVRESFIDPPKIKLGECIYCAKPHCKLFPEYSNQYGAHDRFSMRVCPVEAVHLKDDGKVEIDADSCVGCTLCVLRCPFNSIHLGESKAIVNLANSYIELPYSEKLKQTELLITKMGIQPRFNICDFGAIIDGFTKQITEPGKEWKKDAFYTYVRNLFRYFDLEALYSGSGGMKTRSDVTIVNPFLVTSEVKSPAEGAIGVGAIRQAVGAAAQMGTNLTCAIGIRVQKGAIEEELKWRKTAPNVKTLLIEIKYLLYLALIKNYLGLDADSIKDLIDNYPGYFGKEQLLSFIEHEGTRKRSDRKLIEDILSNARSIF